MDSLSQIVLGASVGAAVFGKTHGRKAVLIGAICGTIPDLDVFIPLENPVADFTYHRSLTHSLIFCLFATPLFVWLFSKIKWFQVNFRDKKVHLGVFLIFLTHIILDGLTVYGTQIFWPLQTPPIAIGSIFIIDPLYTLPFLGFLIWFLITKSLKAIYIGVMLSTLYLCWAFGAQTYVKHIAHKQLDGVSENNILVHSTPLNSLLWRILWTDNDNYYVGYYSVFDKSDDIEFVPYPRNLKLLSGYEDIEEVKRLQWFTHGFYAVEKVGNDIVMKDLRMGSEPNSYVFQFIINKPTFEMVSSQRDMSQLKIIYDRIFRDASWNGAVQ